MFRSKFVVLLLAAVCFAPGVGNAQVTIDERLAPGEPPVIIAHRALGGGAPENSLAGILHAIDRGIDMIEVDVQITRDGQYILMHDPNLTRTTNVADVFPDGTPHREPNDPMARKHMISDYTLEDMAQFRLRDEAGGDHPVPSLDAALALAEGRLLVMLDLKRWEVDSLAAVLEGYDTGNLLLFTLTDPWRLKDTADATGVGVFATLSDTYDVSAGFEKALDRFGPALEMIDFSPRKITPELRAEAGELGIAVGLDGMGFEDPRLLAGSPEPWSKLLDMGAAAYWTDHPDAVLELMGR